MRAPTEEVRGRGAGGGPRQARRATSPREGGGEATRGQRGWLREWRREDRPSGNPKARRGAQPRTQLV